VTCSLRGSERDEALRTAWAAAELEGQGGPLTVEGQLAVIRHAAWGGFEGFTEYRLIDARPVRP
jgi:hypothetical protein